MAEQKAVGAMDCQSQLRKTVELGADLLVEFYLNHSEIIKPDYFVPNSSSSYS